MSYLDDFKHKGPLTEIISRLGILDKWMREVKAKGTGGGSTFNANYGLAGAKPAATGSGNYYFETDTLKLWQDQGAWVLLTPGRTMEGWNILGATVPGSSTRTLTPLAVGLQVSAVNTYYSMPVIIKNLYFRHGAQPAGGSMTCTAFHNGIAAALAITVPAGVAAGVESDIINTVTMVAGDYLRFDCVNNAGVASATIGSVTYEQDFT